MQARVKAEERQGISVLRLTLSRLEALTRLSGALRWDKSVPEGQSILSHDARGFLESIESIIGKTLRELYEQEACQALLGKHDRYANAHKRPLMRELVDLYAANVEGFCNERENQAEEWFAKNSGSPVKTTILRITIARLSLLNTMISHLTQREGMSEPTAENVTTNQKFISGLRHELDQVNKEASRIKNHNWKLGDTTYEGQPTTVQQEAIRLAEEDWEHVWRAILSNLSRDCMNWKFDAK